MKRHLTPSSRLAKEIIPLPSVNNSETPLRRRYRRWVILLIIMVSGVAPPARSAPPAPGPDVIEQVDTGFINWSTGSVHALGVSSPLTVDSASGGLQERILMSAKATAAERLLSTARHVRIRSGLSIGDVVDNSPGVAEELSGLVQNLPVASQRYLSDGTAEVELILPLYGGTAQLLLPEDIRQVQPIKAISPASSTPPKTPPATTPPKENSPKQHPYTGWVLDARGTGAMAAMTIAVRDESGRTVYGSAFVSREFAVHSGMSAYSAVPDPENMAARVGPHPMSTRVLRAVGESRTDLVVSNADAARLRSAVAHLTFLRECRVLVVLDPQPE